MGKVLPTVGVYAIELHIPPVEYKGRHYPGRVVLLQNYTGERWRANHHRKFYAKKHKGEGTVTVRWIGSAPGQGEEGSG